MPRVRRLAIVETLQAIVQSRDIEGADAEVDKEALSIILENIKTSPYITMEDFIAASDEVLTYVMRQQYYLQKDTMNAMKEKIAQQDWEGLLAIASMKEHNESLANEREPLNLQMVDSERLLNSTGTHTSGNYGSMTNSKYQIKLNNAQRLYSF